MKCVGGAGEMWGAWWGLGRGEKAVGGEVGIKM